MVFPVRSLAPLTLLAPLALGPGLARAAGYHPFAPERRGVRTVDLSAEAVARERSRYVAPRGYPEAPAFDRLDAIAAEAAAAAAAAAKGPAPTDPAAAEGLLPRGSVVVPEPIAGGERVDPAVVHAFEDIPGNEYPRKHTLYLNFTGGMLYTGTDNSAESRSSLAQQGDYPTFSGGEAKAIAAAQETANDVAAFGIRVVYLERPPKILPYTMVMVGGSWQDTNIGSPAGGVAPGTDCGALGQRHVVYTFAPGGWSAADIANVNSQEAGHAWGLDHSLNCSSVMSYCGVGNGVFSGTCDGLCEAPCSDLAGCQLFHEDFCGEDSDQQNEAEELTFIFGGNEPDLEPPFVEIVSPTDGLLVEEGGDVDLRAVVDDDYGGYGWRFEITHEDELVYDQVDYDRDVDPEYRAALNLVNLEPGVYTITVEIQDHFEHVSTDTVTFTVDGEVVTDDDSGTADDTAGGTDDGVPATGDPSSGTSTGDETGGPAVDDPGPEQGCTCRSDGAPRGSGWALWALGGLWGLRRGRLRKLRNREIGRRAGTRTPRARPEA